MARVMRCTSDSCSSRAAEFSDFWELFLRSSFSISADVVELRKTRRFPSGDQTGRVAPFGRLVMVRASPPPNDNNAICGGRGFPSVSFSPARTKAMVRPSADQRGLESCLPFVSREGESAPLVVVDQIEVS